MIIAPSHRRLADGGAGGMMGRLAICIALLLPTSARAATCGGPSGFDPQSISGTFGAGSIIIPMDTCYNPDQANNDGPTNTGGACGSLPAYGYPSGATCYNKA